MQKKCRKWVHNLCRMYRNHWKPFVCVCVVVWRPKKSETLFAVGQETDLKQSLNQCCAKALDNEDWHQSAKFEGRTGKATPCPWVLSPRLQWKTKQDERKVFTASLFFWCFWEPFHKSTGPCLCPCSNSKIHQGSLWKVVPNAKWNREEPQCMHKGSNQSVDTWATPGWKGSCLKLCMLSFEMKKTEQVETSWNK